MRRAIVLVALVWGLSAPTAPAQELFPIQAIGGAPHVVQSLMQVLYPQYPNITYTYTLPLPQAVTVGDAVFGAALYEPNTGGGQFTSGNLDTIMVGTQAAVIDDVGSQCCGPAIVTFHLLNVSNAATGITFSSSTSGTFLTEDTAFAEVAGLPASAAIDAHAAQYLQVPAGGVITSGTITPSTSGDFLYGIGFKYDGSEPPLGAGSGWTLINNCATAPGQCADFAFDPGHEWQVYGSTDPIAATFSIANQAGGGESWVGIIAVKP